MASENKPLDRRTDRDIRVTREWLDDAGFVLDPPEEAEETKDKAA
jgi:hypothetical protein